MKGITENLARQIMGNKIWTMEDWTSSYRWNPPSKLRYQFSTLKFDMSRIKTFEFPWSEDILYSPCRFNKNKLVYDTHFAVMGLDWMEGKLNILKFQKLHPSTALSRTLDYLWCTKEKFAIETTMSLQWHLLYIGVIPKSENKTYDEQVMLPVEYEVSSAINETAKNLLLFRKTGIFANPTKYGRCADVDSDGNHVVVGYSHTDGLRIRECQNDARGNEIGIVAERKVPK